ncbi:TPA: hypothetical protein ACQZE6_004922 [Escherichia coli]|uniref:hypothetical protein n=1 Tax=Escherichia coli TaxID=562 RepID=UPI000BE6C189|nr:hypothetical protein [Escherichia coli]
MESIITFIVIFLIILACFLMLGSSKSLAEEYKKQKGDFFKRNNIKPTDFVWFKRKVDNEIGFSVDNEKFTVVSIVGKKTRNSYKCITFKKDFLAKDILEVSLVEDNNVTQTIKNNGSTLGRGVVGAMTFGVAGAVVGALSASSSKTIDTKKVIHKIELGITINDLNNPLNNFVIFEGNISPESKEYNNIKGKLASLVSRVKISSGLFK